jgi:hypothetical protein
MNQADRGQPDALQMPAAGCEAARRRIPLQFGFQPYNSPDPPKKFRCSVRSGIRVGRKWNQQLARSHSACEARNQPYFSVFPRRTAELATRYLVSGGENEIPVG